MATGAGRHDRTRAEPGLAYSTGQAARYCYVTSDTILNWIHSGSLTAQRTAGGQHRIRREDLLEFMCEHGMRTDLLLAEADVRPHCWEFHCSGELDARCLTCAAYRSRAINCFELRSVDRTHDHLLPTCGACDYYRQFQGPVEETR
jgi:excisionase family DNA binding protein